MPMHEPILVVNTGSSSIKFSVFETRTDRSLSAGAHGQIEGIGTSPHLEVGDGRGHKLAERAVEAASHEAAIAAIARASPNLPQVACFDTAFHRNQPAVAQEFALPHHYTAKGIRRYGFH